MKVIDLKSLFKITTKGPIDFYYMIRNPFYISRLNIETNLAMGQNEVKIPTADHLILFRLTKYNHLEIQVYATFNKHNMLLEYCQSYSYHELSQQVKEQYHSIKSLFTAISQSTGLCCTGTGHGKLRIEFQQGKVIMQKHVHGKQLIIKIHKVNEQHSSDIMTEQLNSKLVSQQDRLGKQIQSQKISQQQNTDMTKQRSIKATYNQNDKQKSSIIKNNVLVQGKDYYRTKNGIYINLFNHNNLRKQTSTQKEIIDSIKFSILSPMIVVSLDLIGNKITSTGLKTLLKMNWKCLKKLWLDDNLIEDVTGLEQLNNLMFLGLSNNLLNRQAAQILSLCKYQKLQYLKISFIKSELQSQMCINLMWSDNGSNLPALKKLVILNNRPLQQGLKRKFKQWKNSDEFLDRDCVIVINQELPKYMTRKKNYIEKLNHIDDYPQIY